MNRECCVGASICTRTALGVFPFLQLIVFLALLVRCVVCHAVLLLDPASELADEITTDLDVITRSDFLEFLKVRLMPCRPP